MKTRLFSLAIILSSILPIWGQANFTIGADIGSNTEREARGLKLYNWLGEEREATALMKEMGMTAIRIRVWVDNNGNGLDSHGKPYCTKADVLEKARRAHALGMDIMIDFHYSDWWADPAKQNIPKAWEKLSYKKMLRAVADHTTDILTALKAEGITPRWVQVGNETSNGMLWSVEMDPQTGWEKKDADGHTIITKSMGHWERNPQQYAGFMRAGYDAVKAVCPEAKVIVHLDNGFDNALYNKNLDIIRDNVGQAWDIIGMSLYPYWSIEGGKEPTALKTIVDCMRNIRLLSKKYGCDCMITETGFEVDEQHPWVMEQGREQFAELIRRARTETDGHCLGIFYWQPESRPSEYKLGAFTDDGHPTSIMRAILSQGIGNREQGIEDMHSKHETDSGNLLLPITSSLLPKYDRKIVRLVTTEGDIYVELYNETPLHRDNFIRLAKTGALDQTLFHRVIEGFMIQGGDPDSKTAPATSVDNPAPMLGDGDVPREDGTLRIPAEIRYPQFFHKRGALAAAREGDDENPTKESSASQFYIVWGKSPVTRGKHPYQPLLDYYETDSVTGKAQSHRRYWATTAAPMPEAQPGTPWLDGGYTVFGEVIAGLDIVDKIQQVKTDKNDRPLSDIRLLRMEVMN